MTLHKIFYYIERNKHHNKIKFKIFKNFVCILVTFPTRNRHFPIQAK